MSLAGRLLYQLWHRPTGAIENSLRRGGPLRQFAAARGRRAMIAAAGSLPPLPARPGRAAVVHFLTGRRFAYQTAFCLHTLARHSPVPVAPEFYDDGSLNGDARALLQRLAPAAPIHDFALLRDRLEAILPSARFPTLRERWRNYPHLRKLIDVHAGRTGWRLVLDSDLLFWREPRFLLDWLAAPDRPLHATDCAENYGYPRATLERMAGRPLPALVNVGLCGWRSEDIDWEFLEHAAATLLREHGTSYYLEQGLVALLAARHGEARAIAPANDYLTYPSAAEIAQPTAVMHHYVDLSRDAYHLTAWRQALQSS